MTRYFVERNTIIRVRFSLYLIADCFRKGKATETRGAAYFNNLRFPRKFLYHVSCFWNSTRQRAGTGALLAIYRKSSSFSGYYNRNLCHTCHTLKTKLKDSARNTPMEEHFNIFAINFMKQVKTTRQSKGKLLQDLCS